ncbi:MAG: polyribonucleotide nucleotidyltransferase [Chlamydiae bacterium CG10_big_fil_rev_8_21_14_0_10_35_9]|nr:MAG: polyribonucleotide nucleotidyltransferase [Chlamydiae bacterium CG10_big_fil_rev_8_21_14_0_10_35_9]
MHQESITIKAGDKEIILETGKIARQANGSVMLHCGETTILSTATAAKEPMEGVDFLPLRVDYQEKFSSVGKTASGFIKREGKPSEREVLVSRLTDRPIRPMFEDGYYKDTQLLTYVYSYDGVNIPDVLGILAASAALTISDIPLKKPIGAVRVGFIDQEFIINPTPDQLKQSTLDLVLAGTEDAILMIEGYCDFLTEEQVLEAIEKGHTVIQDICKALLEFQKKVGKEKNKEGLYQIPSEVVAEVQNHAKAPLDEVLSISNKKERDLKFSYYSEQILSAINPDPENPRFEERDIKIALKKYKSERMRSMIVNDKKRIDGRATTEIRPISIEHGLLPRTHGSSLFTRGETQAIAVCTLGGETMAQRYEDLHGEGAHRFYMQYFFPPFSVGEVGRMGPPGRREVGHGKLAERALTAILPDQKEFPYVIRLESNITESNGSSSMASVCGGCLALMDAGVPVKRPVAGIAMGLVLEKDHFAILSDIMGTEDALGDMDFKITGDDKGITAFQMDIKVEGITHEIMRAALLQAKDGRIHILNKMLEVVPSSREKLSTYAPRIETMQIKQNQIGTVIGPGGKQIRAIVEETGVQIDISDEGVVSIASTNPESMERAKEIIINLTGDVEVGKTYTGKVVSIVPFGLFVQIYSKQGLCHISEVSHSRIDDLKNYYKEGDEINVKVLAINDHGQIKLSHKVLLKQED